MKKQSTQKKTGLWKLRTIALPFIPGVLFTKWQIVTAVIVLELIILLLPFIVSAVNLKKKNRSAKSPKTPAKASVDTAAEAALSTDIQEKSCDAQPNAIAPAEQTLSMKDVLEGAEDECLRGVDKEKGIAIIARYKRSYMSRLIQASEEAKFYYSLVKNAFLSYKKITTRISWGYESVNFGRTKLAKLAVKGKTLCLYLALEPEALDAKYKATRTAAAKYADTPCVYKITSDRRAKYALELVDMLCVRNALAPSGAESVDYIMPYESTEQLVARGLIKELISEENYEAFMHRRSLEEVNKKHRDFVSAEEVNSLITDEVAEHIIEDKRTSGAENYTGKKGIINIDTLSENFKSGEVVTLDALKEKKLIDKSVGYVKVLARGVLDKPLTVDLQSYSIEAVKMIALTGGKVERV